MTQKHMGWKIPDLPKSWAFSPQSRFSGSSWGPENKINQRHTLFAWLLFSLPSLSRGVYQGTAFHIITHQLSIPETKNQGKTWAKLTLRHGCSVSAFFMVTECWFLMVHQQVVFHLNSESIALIYFFYTDTIFFSSNKINFFQDFIFFSSILKQRIHLNFGNCFLVLGDYYLQANFKIKIFCGKIKMFVKKMSKLLFSCPLPPHSPPQNFCRLAKFSMDL